MDWLFIICIIYIICFMYITVNPYTIKEFKYKINQIKMERETYKKAMIIEQKKREGNDSLSLDRYD